MFRLRDNAVLQLLSQVSHPWVNQYMQVVGHPDLHGWDVNNPPMIGDIVAAVIREFGRDVPPGSSSGRGQETSPWGDGRLQSAGYSTSPPRPVGGPNVGLSHIGGMEHGRSDAASVLDSCNSVQGREREISSTKSRRQLKDHTPIPAIPTKFDKLESLTTQQLGRLLEDDVARQALLLEMTSVAGMKDLKTEVCKGNVETAQSILSKQESARILRDEGERMRQELKALQASYEGLSNRCLQILILRQCCRSFNFLTMNTFRYIMIHCTRRFLGCAGCCCYRPFGNVLPQADMHIESSMLVRN